MHASPLGQSDKPLHPAAGRELHLLDPATRRDRDTLEDLMHPEFVEVGTTGTVWRREDTIAALLADPGHPGPVDDLSTDELAYGIALVTYRCAGTRRVSVWVREVTKWTIRYHQSTPITAMSENR